MCTFGCPLLRKSTLFKANPQNYDFSGRKMNFETKDF